ncbi:MAG: ABC transporter ATP-binding protein, partial [Alistipes shahii]|nr:ABC transporter ATP-binding protein [Alistipes shahii]
MSLVFSGVSFAYPGSDPLFSDITFTVRPGERVALVGPNGSGKTTLLRIAAGLQPAAGSVSCPAARWYLPQNALCQPGEPVAELLGVARKLAALHAIESGRGTEADFSALDDDWGVGERLDAVRGRWGIASIPLDRPFRTLSGGER